MQLCKGRKKAAGKFTFTCFVIAVYTLVYAKACGYLFPGHIVIFPKIFKPGMIHKITDL